MKYRSLFAVDPSLTCSGWAFFSVPSNALIAVGKIRSLPPKLNLAERLADLQTKISKTFEDLKLGEKDVLICESPTTMRDPKAAFKVEQVRGIFETVARTFKVAVPGRLNPRSIHYEVLGLRGKQLERSIIKEVAVNAVRNIFGSSLENIGFACDNGHLKKHQDIVDALLIGSLGLTRISTAQFSGVALEEIFSSSKPRRVGKVAVR